MSLLIGPRSPSLTFDTPLIRSLIARGEGSRLNSPCFKSEHVRLVRYRVRVSKRPRHRSAACLRAVLYRRLNFVCLDLKGVTMRLKALWISLCLLLACAGLAAFAVDRPSAGQAATSAGVKAFVGARLIDGSGKPAVENAALIARDGRVEAVGPASEVKTPAGAQTINLAGKFIIPGLISTHVHVSDVQGLRPPAYTEENTLRQLGVFARYGVTSVLSLGGEKEPAFKARDAQNTPSLDRTRIYLAGDVITGNTPQEARQMVARVADLKPDVIKIRVDDNLGATTKMTPE